MCVHAWHVEGQVGDSFLLPHYTRLYFTILCIYCLAKADCGEQLLHGGVEVARQALVAQTHEAILVAGLGSNFVLILV